MEVYRDKLITYGCGDFLNDYEGIEGYERFRSDLCWMYFAKLEKSTSKLPSLDMMPTHVRHLRVNRASENDVIWLRDTLDREVIKFGARMQLKGNIP